MNHTRDCFPHWFYDAEDRKPPTEWYKPVDIPRRPLLDEVKRTIAERSEQYGPSGPEFERIAKVWSALLQVDVPPRLVPLMLSGMKLVRESTKPKRDNLIDICGNSVRLDEYLTSGEGNAKVVPPPKDKV